MKQLFIVVLISFAVTHTDAEVKLPKNTEKTISVSDKAIQILIDNPKGKEGNLIVCFGSASNTKSSGCPDGYASFEEFLIESEKSKTYTINRDSTIVDYPNKLVKGNIKFKDDNILNVLIPEVPDGVEIVVINAKETDSRDDQKSADVVIWIIVGGVCIAVIMMIIAFLVYWFVLRKRRAKAAPTILHKDEPAPTVEEQPLPLDQSVPIVVPAKPSQESTTPATKKTTSSTTKPSSEKLEAPTHVQSVPATVRPPVAVECAPEPIPTSKDEIPTLSTAKSMKKTKSKRKKSKKQIPGKSETQPAQSTTPAKQISPLLPVDKTQSPTERSPTTTQPTPEFGNDTTANTLADQSACNPREYVPYSEAPLPGQPPRRERPITDEVVKFRRTTETVVCYCQRRKYLSGHDHMRLVERINFIMQHLISDAERRLLKAEAKDAPYLADIVVAEANAAIAKHADFGGSFDEGKPFWKFVNKPSTPASVGLLLLLRLKPELFALKENSLADEKVRTMPLSGLYILLLNAQLPDTFRIQLAGELRKRAASVVPFIQKDMMKKAAFPSQYLMRAYHKNAKSFVEGSEIHSRSHRSV